MEGEVVWISSLGIENVSNYSSDSLTLICLITSDKIITTLLQKIIKIQKNLYYYRLSVITVVSVPR